MAGTALIVTDMLNPYEHDDADELAANAESVIDPIRKLIDRARDEDADLIYVNDNFDDWDSSRESLIEQALAGRRRDLVEPLVPEGDFSFIVKARHSIFYGTPLAYLLGQREIDHLVLCGQVTEQCILYSALDAYVRHFRVSIPSDAVAHIDEELARAALQMMERNMRAQICAADDCDLRGP